MTVLGFVYLFVCLYIRPQQHASTHNLVSQLYSCILKDGESKWSPSDIGGRSVASETRKEDFEIAETLFHSSVFGFHYESDKEPSKGEGKFRNTIQSWLQKPGFKRYVECQSKRLCITLA